MGMLCWGLAQPSSRFPCGLVSPHHSTYDTILLFCFFWNVLYRRSSPKLRDTVPNFPLSAAPSVVSTHWWNDGMSVCMKSTCHKAKHAVRPQLVWAGILTILVRKKKKDLGVFCQAGVWEHERDGWFVRKSLDFFKIHGPWSPLPGPGALSHPTLHLCCRLPWARHTCSSSSSYWDQKPSALSNKHSIYCGSLKVCGRPGGTDSTFLLPALPGLHERSSLPSMHCRAGTESEGIGPGARWGTLGESLASSHPPL